MFRNQFWLPAKGIIIWLLFGTNIVALAAGLLLNSYEAISLSIVISGLILSLVTANDARVDNILPDEEHEDQESPSELQ